MYRRIRGRGKGGRFLSFRFVEVAEEMKVEARLEENVPPGVLESGCRGSRQPRHTDARIRSLGTLYCPNHSAQIRSPSPSGTWHCTAERQYASWFALYESLWAVS